MRRSASLSLGFTAPLAWRSLICRLGRRHGKLGRLPFKYAASREPCSGFIHLRRIPAPCARLSLWQKTSSYQTPTLFLAHPQKHFTRRYSRNYQRFAAATSKQLCNCKSNCCSPFKKLSKIRKAHSQKLLHSRTLLNLLQAI